MDVRDDVDSSFVVDFIDKCMVTLEKIFKKNAIVTACKSKCFKSWITLRYTKDIVDLGIVTFSKIGVIFEHINEHGYWITEDEGWINYDFTHKRFKEIIQATEKERDGNQLLAGLSGIDKDKGFNILHGWVNCY